MLAHEEGHEDAIHTRKYSNESTASTESTENTENTVIKAQKVQKMKKCSNENTVMITKEKKKGLEF